MCRVRREVLKLMEVERLHHIPVVDDDRKVIGISTRDALINYLLYEAEFSGAIWTAPENPTANGQSEG
jgi:CBS domain-containing protein